MISIATYNFKKLLRRASIHGVRACVSIASSTWSCLFKQKERDKVEVSTWWGSTGQSYLRPWLTRDIVWPGRSGEDSGEEPGFEAIGGREP